MNPSDLHIKNISFLKYYSFFGKDFICRALKLRTYDVGLFPCQVTICEVTLGGPSFKDWQQSEVC